MTRRKWSAITAIAVVGLGAAAPAPPAAGSTTGPPPPATVQTARTPGAEDAAGATVTLITGDVVSVGAGTAGQVSVQPVPRKDGRTPAFDVHGSSATASTPATLYVVPEDAQPLIASGQLDRSLFDVDQLRRDGYGVDGHAVPLISSFTGSVAKTSLAAQSLAGSTRSRVLESINATAVSVPPRQAATFWRGLTAPASTARAAKVEAKVQRLTLDRPVHAALDKSVPQVHAPEAWAEGYDGTGVKVAILDTGIDATHPDLAGKVIGTHDFVDSTGSVVDGHGHGTHVASIIAGTGAASGGKYRGVAPGAKLLIGKVLGDNGSGSVSYLIDGAEWAADQGAQVVNMSIGGIAAPQADGKDPLEQAIDLISRYTKTLFVIAAGNSGPEPGTLEYPGVTTSALTVAAVDSTDTVASFSSRGPLPSTYTRTLKPDIAAPGVSITAARAAGTSMGTPVDDHYTQASGTSMATPHVSGGAAIVAQAHPDWTGQQLKQALTAASDEIGGSVYARGAGRLNVERAVHESVTTTGALDFGHSAENVTTPVDRDVTYANATASATTLTLSATLHNDATGAGVPSTAVTLPASVTVPANGTASVAAHLEVTGLTEGKYSGTLTATDPAGHTTRTAIGYVRDPLTYPVVVTVDGRDGAGCGTGAACSNFEGVSAINLDHPEYSAELPASSGYLNLRPGRYEFVATVEFIESGRINTAVLVEPEVVVGPSLTPPYPQSVHLKLARAQQVKIQTDRETEAYGGTLLATRRFGADQYNFSGWIGTDYYSTTQWALPAPKVTTGSFLLAISQTRGAVGLSGTVVGGDRMPIHPWYRSYNSAVTFPAALRARVVDVGEGLDKAEAKAVRGAIALARPVTVPGQDADSGQLSDAQVQALEDAGAIGILAWSPTVTEAFVPSVHDGTVPIAGLPKDEGNELTNRLAAGALKLDLVSRTPSPYRYSLKFYEKDSVPSSLSYRVADSQLATIKTEVRSSGPEAELYRSFDLGYWPGGSEVIGIAPMTDVTAPATVTKLIGPVRPDVQWFRWVRSGADEVSSYRWSTLTAGRQKPEVLNPALLTPGAAVAQSVGERPCSICRSGDDLLVRPTGSYGDPAAIADGAVPGTYLNGQVPVVQPLQPEDTKLYAGKKEIPMAELLPHQTGRYVVPEGPTNLRLVYDRTGAPTSTPYGRALHAEWTFHSERPTTSTTAGTVCPPSVQGACGVEPLLQVRPDVALDAHNRAPRGGGKVTLTAYHESSTATPAELSSMAVKVSFDDGASWTKVAVKGTGNLRTVTVPRAPAQATAVSLQVSATDAAGNTVSLVLPKAYGLAG